MSDTTSNSLKLRTLFESLPQELYNEIFNLVWTGIAPLNPGATIIIDAEYMPPKALQLCRTIRRNFAAKYYTKHTFTVGGTEAEDILMLFKWKDSLVSAHDKLVRFPGEMNDVEDALNPWF